MKTSDSLTEHFRMTQRQKDALERLNISTIHDLLYHLPSRYDGFEEKPGSLQRNTKISIQGEIKKILMRRVFRKKTMMTEAQVISGEKIIKIMWFNQPYISKKFKAGDKVKLTGSVSGTEGKEYLANPDISPSVINEEPKLMKKSTELIAVYPETFGISSMWIREKISRILQELEEVIDPVPKKILKQYSLPELKTALFFIHQPKNMKDVTVAKKRLSFDEIFFLQISKYKERKEFKDKQAICIKTDEEELKTIHKRFNFKLTDCQNRVINEIIKDLGGENGPMKRILQGDVGSGKTAVAGALMHTVVTTIPSNQKAGRLQVAYLVPTEILAEQQYKFFKDFFSHLGLSVGLITSKQCRKFPSKLKNTEDTEISKAQLKRWLLSGEVSVVVGTHSIIQKDVEFKNLALVIVDEQHRFGVAQRSILLRNDKVTPHMLSMSATPIPRTLALTIYGDLDISIINEMPKDRKVPKTFFLKEKDREKAYEQMEKELANKRQAYIICPLVDEGEDDSLVHSVDTEEKIIKKRFPRHSVAKLHGRMKQKEKSELMEKFRKNEVQILVSTTVVEVGIDISNATVMIIENAERFGLAQLHQLRGRISRSNFEPYCFIISNSTSDITLERLKTFTGIRDGFKLAEKDLKYRGSGKLFGVSQSGVSDIGMEALRNPKLIEITQKEAKKLIEKDPNLNKHTDIKIEIIRRNLSPYQS